MNEISTIGIIYLIFFSGSFSASCIWLWCVIKDGKDIYFPMCSIIISFTMVIMVVVSVVENSKSKKKEEQKNDETAIH